MEWSAQQGCVPQGAGTQTGGLGPRRRRGTGQPQRTHTRTHTHGGARRQHTQKHMHTARADTRADTHVATLVSLRVFPSSHLLCVSWVQTGWPWPAHSHTNAHTCVHRARGCAHTHKHAHLCVHTHAQTAQQSLASGEEAGRCPVALATHPGTSPSLVCAARLLAVGKRGLLGTLTPHKGSRWLCHDSLDPTKLRGEKAAQPGVRAGVRALPRGAVGRDAPSPGGGGDTAPQPQDLGRDRAQHHDSGHSRPKNPRVSQLRGGGLRGPQL